MVVVSIIIPSFNHGQFLETTLKGVVNQTFQEWELLFLDDGSQDNSLEIAQRFADADPRIKVSRNPSNLGTYASLNRGIEMATYEWISILNSDDAWHPDKLSFQIEGLKANPECHFSYTRGVLVDENTENLEVDHHRDYPIDSIQNPLIHLFDVNQILASSLVFKKSSIRFVSKLRYSGDWVGAIRLARTSPGFFVDQPVTSWRQHGANSFTKYAKILPEEIWVRSWIQRNGFSWLQTVDDLARHKMAAGALILGTQLYLAKNLRASRSYLRKAMNLGDSETKRTATKRLLASFLPRTTLERRFGGQASQEKIDIFGDNFDDLEGKF